jgi:hypothetical protein
MPKIRIGPHRRNDDQRNQKQMRQQGGEPPLPALLFPSWKADGRPIDVH